MRIPVVPFIFVAAILVIPGCGPSSSGKTDDSVKSASTAGEGGEGSSSPEKSAGETDVLTEDPSVAADISVLRQSGFEGVRLDTQNDSGGQGPMYWADFGSCSLSIWKRSVGDWTDGFIFNDVSNSSRTSYGGVPGFFDGPPLVDGYPFVRYYYIMSGSDQPGDGGFSPNPNAAATLGSYFAKNGNLGPGMDFTGCTPGG